MTALSRRGFIAGLGCLAVPSLGSAEEAIATGLSKNRRKHIAAKVERFRSTYGAPGLSVAYSRNGKLAYVAAFGLADRDNGEALTTAHRFRIASIAKPITASAIMLLAERKALSVQQRVFGSDGILGRRFPTPPSAGRWLEDITIDHLLSHTTGAWTNDNNDPMFKYPLADHDTLIVRTLAEAPLSGPPGRNYAYSNFGYCLLGRIIEEASGMRYARFVRQWILEPAGAGSMEIGGNWLKDRRQGEVVYFTQGGGDAYGMNVARMDSHGGWIGTATDLVRFALRVDGYKSVPDLLSRSSVKLMATPTKATKTYGRGWALNPQHHNWWHTGGMPGTATILVRVDGGVCFAGLVNTRAGGNPDVHGALDTLMWDIYSEVIV